VARISTRADEDDGHALFSEPGLGVTHQSAADAVALRRRIDTNDADLADPATGIDHEGGRESDQAAIRLGDPGSDRIGAKDLAHLRCVVVPPVLTVKKLGQFSAEDLID
jgi:hypothetical protein